MSVECEQYLADACELEEGGMLGAVGHVEEGCDGSEVVEGRRSRASMLARGRRHAWPVKAK
jgi:hypothetical protein